MVRKDVNFSNALTGERLSSSASSSSGSPSREPSAGFAFKGSKASGIQAKYKRLRNVYEDNGFSDLQFEKRAPKFPSKAIALASFLFLAGLGAIAVSVLSLTGHFDSKPTDGALVLMVLGFLMFIPGSYHVMLAYYAFQDYPGYSYDDIPDFD